MSLTLAAMLLLSSSLSPQVVARNTDSSAPVHFVEDADAARQAIRRTYYYIQSDDLANAAAAIDEVVRSPSFAKLPPQERYAATLLAGAIAFDRSETDAAHRWFVQASEFKNAESPSWHSRLRAAFDLKDYVDSARCVAQIAKRWPKTLGEINGQAIFRMATELDRPEHDELHRDLLESLFDAGWSGGDVTPDGLWVDLARLLLARNDVRKAKRVAEQVHAPFEVVALRADRRFDRITRNDPKVFDVEHTSELALKKIEADVRASPDRLQPLVELQLHLLRTLRFERVLSIADDVVAKAAASGGAKTYKDFDDHYAWILDHRAEALSGLGRWDDALKQREKAARRPEGGQMNVSQVINLGELYILLGRPDDALDAIAEVGIMSPYGRMQLEMIRLNAALQRDDVQGIARHLDFMREHRADAISTWQRALIVSGDAEGAEKTLLERLRREDWRSEALIEIQNYADLPSTPTLSKQRAQWTAFLARPGVQSAVATVGRIERYPLSGPRS